MFTPNVGRFHTSLDFCGAMSSSTIEREVHAIRRADRDCDTALEAMARNKTTRHKVLPATLHAGAATAGPGACAQRDLAQVVSNLRSWLGYRARDGFRWMGRDGAGDRRPICGMRRWPLSVACPVDVLIRVSTYYCKYVLPRSPRPPAGAVHLVPPLALKDLLRDARWPR